MSDPDPALNSSRSGPRASDPLRGDTYALGVQKRFFDVLASSILLVLFLAPGIVLALIIAAQRRGNPIFRQQRVGLRGRSFEILKLRTVEDISPGDGSIERPIADAPRRTTRLGRLLRRTGLDELPQLWNVLRGEMSLVGPRPELPVLSSRYPSRGARRLDVRPGLTGLWQVMGASDRPIFTQLAYDLYYVRNASLGLDLKILARTMVVAIFGRPRAAARDDSQTRTRKRPEASRSSPTGGCEDPGLAPRPSTTSRVVRGYLVVAGLTVGIKAIGFSEKLLVGYWFGTSETVDAIFFASSIVMSCFVIAREIAEPAIIPVFVGLRAKGDMIEARRFGRTMSTLALLTGSLIASVLFVFPSAVVSVFAPGFSATQAGTSSELLRILSVGLPASITAVVTYCLLNGQRRFLPSLGADAIDRGVALVALAAGAAALGIHALAIGIATGAAARLACHGLALRRDGLVGPSLALGTPSMRSARRLAAPVFVGIAFSQLSERVDVAIASGFDKGSLAALTFARKLIDLPVLLIPYAVSIVMLPHLSACFAKDSPHEFARRTRAFFVAATFLFVPVAIVSVADGLTIVRLALERGQFDAASSQATAEPFLILALGLPTFAADAVLVQMFYAMHDTRTPIVVGIVGVLINIPATLLLSASFGVPGIAGALVISKTFKVALLLLLAGSVLRRSLSRTLGLHFASLLGGLAGLALVRVWSRSAPSHDSKFDMLGFLSIDTIVVLLGSLAGFGAAIRIARATRSR